MKKISIIIINWNGTKDTLKCLDSLIKLDKLTGYNHEIVIVDNGSDDKISRYLGRFPLVKILEQNENLGFSGGCNEGIKYAMNSNSDYIWLLNNDTYVRPDSIRLVEAFSDSTIGIAGSKIYFAPGSEYHRDRYRDDDRGKIIWYAGGIIDWDNMYASHRGVDEIDNGQYDSVTETDFISGCSMMIRGKVIEKTGLFDNKFYLYLEDLDYCLRAKKNNYKLVYFPKSEIWHVNAGSSGGSGSKMHQYYQTRNRILVGMRYAPVKTKIALLRESAGFLYKGSTEQKKAITDAICGKWGRQYDKKQ